MIPVPRPASRAPLIPIVHSHSSWSIGVGRHRLEISRTRQINEIGFERYRASDLGRRPIWSVAAGVFASVSAFGLLVFGAWAAPRAIAPTTYSVSIPVPSAARATVSVPVARPSRSTVISPEKSGAVPAIAAVETEDDRHVATALRTGEFQEWVEADGSQRFLTAGAATLEGGKFCRDLALLTRLPGGGSHVRSERRCTAGPISDALPSSAAPVLSDDAGASDAKMTDP